LTINGRLFDRDGNAGTWNHGSYPTDASHDAAADGPHSWRLKRGRDCRDGRFRFETIRPAPSGPVAAHIHVSPTDRN
jgi:protocatechuate 3,4-dioxygenase beta subunit